MDADDGVTLGEVARGIAAVRTDLRDLSKDVVELKVTTGTQADKTQGREVRGPGLVSSPDMRDMGNGTP